METLQTIKELKIQTNKIFYDKKSEVLSVYLPDFVFIGTYKKSVRIEIVLDDIYGSLGETQITRQSISIVDFVTLQPISEKTKLKQLKLISKKQNELQKDKKKPVADTRDREPPILNLRVEGKGFEVHPLFGKVEVSKDAVNPPVMIFSVLPVKNKNRSKKDKKEGDRRHLHVYIDFEDKVINRSILSIIVQPKHFHIDIGPLHLDISKKGAAVISLISLIITAISLLYKIGRASCRERV